MAATRQSGRDSARRQALRLAYRILSAGGEDPPEPLVVTFAAGDGSVSHVERSRPGELALLRASARLPETQANILQALYELGGDRQPRAIARQAGYAYNSRFRTELRKLQVAGLVTRTPDGYRLSLPRDKRRRPRA